MALIAGEELSRLKTEANEALGLIEDLNRFFFKAIDERIAKQSEDLEKTKTGEDPKYDFFMDALKGLYEDKLYTEYAPMVRGMLLVSLFGSVERILLRLCGAIHKEAKERDGNSAPAKLTISDIAVRGKRDDVSKAARYMTKLVGLRLSDFFGYEAPLLRELRHVMAHSNGICTVERFHGIQESAQRVDKRYGDECAALTIFWEDRMEEDDRSKVVLGDGFIECAIGRTKLMYAHLFSEIRQTTGR